MPANEAHLGEGGPSRVEPKYLDLGRNRNMHTHTHMTHKHVSTRGTDVCVEGLRRLRQRGRGKGVTAMATVATASARLTRSVLVVSRV